MLASIMGVSIHDIPKEFFCPVLMKVMTDPVTTTVGSTYERRAIESWFRRGFNSDPVTGANLVNNKLVPNTGLREAISSYNPAVNSNYQKASISVNVLNKPPPFTNINDTLNDKSSNVLDLITMLHTTMTERDLSKSKDKDKSKVKTESESKLNKNNVSNVLNGYYSICCEISMHGC